MVSASTVVSVVVSPAGRFPSDFVFSHQNNKIRKMFGVEAVLKILIVVLFLSSNVCSQYYALQTEVSWDVGSVSPPVRPQVEYDTTGLTVNSKGIFKVTNNYNTLVYNITESTNLRFLASSTSPSLDVTYGIFFNSSNFGLVIDRYMGDGSLVWELPVSVQGLFGFGACQATDTVAQAINNNTALIFAQYCNVSNNPFTYILRVNSETVQLYSQFAYLMSPGAMATDANNKIIMVGHMKQNDSQTAVSSSLKEGTPFVLRLNPDLSLDWVQGLPLSSTGPTELTYGLVLTPSWIFIGGGVHSNITGYATGQSNSNADGYIAKYSHLGVLQNATIIASPMDDYIFDLTEDTQGNIYACGWTKGNFSSPAESNPVYRMFISRFNQQLVFNKTKIEASWNASSNIYPGVSCTYNALNGVLYTVMRLSNTSFVRRSFVDLTLPSPSTSPSTSPASSRTPTPSKTPSKTPSISKTPSLGYTPSVSMTPSPSSVPSSLVSPSTSVTVPSPSPTRSTTPAASPSVTPILSPTSNPTPAPSLEESTGTSPTHLGSDASSDSTMVPILAGAIAGGVVLIASVAATFVWLAFRRKKNKEKDDTRDIPLYDAPPGTQKQTPQSKPAPRDTSTIEQYFEIPYQELSMEKEIGRGAFGIVYKASPCVVKQLNLTDPASKEEFLKEAANVRKLRSHPNVCTVFGVCSDPNYPTSIVMEFVEGGSLKELVYSDSCTMDSLTILRIAKDIAGGMSHIHKEGLLHCDLACRNLLYQVVNSKYLIKVTDLGLARVSESGHYDASEGAKFPIRWSAPEVLTKRQLSRATDVWSFGVVIYEILEGKLPYYDLQNSEVTKFVCKGGFLEAPTRFNFPELWELATRCMSVDASKRPTFDELFLEIEELERKLDPNNNNADKKISEPHYHDPNQTPYSTSKYATTEITAPNYANASLSTYNSQ